MSDLRVPISTQFDAPFVARETGLVGTVAYRLDDNDGNTVLGPTTAGISELGTTGVYLAKPTSPGTEGDWTLLWSKDGTFDPTTVAIDYLVTYDPGVSPPIVPPLEPIADDGTRSVGPCSAWATSEDVAVCCGTDSDVTLLDLPVVAASQVLYALTNNEFTGTCESRVRPCGSPCGGPWQRWQGWGWLPMNRDLGVFGSWPAMGDGCGCQPLSRVPLAGAAREILEVTIDGSILDPTAYRLDQRRWLTRIDGDAWPACQDMEAAETEDGTFSILYTYGQDPPVIGQLAAQQLACQIFATCPGGGDAAAIADCELPSGVVEIQRHGITIKTNGFLSWGYNAARGEWQTGMDLVDMFLNTYAPQGRQGRTRVWSPDMRRFPKRIAGAT